MFLSLYGGVGNSAKAAAECGLLGVVLDTADSEANNVCLGRVDKDIRSCIMRGRVGGVGIDLVCASWSIARRAPEWSSFPSALRSEQHMLGLPHLTGKDLAKVKAGNQMYYRALVLIKLCLKHGVPGYLENPRSSRLFKMKGFVQLVKAGKARFVDTDMCAYGTCWKKPTRLLVWGKSSELVELRRCKPCHGRCNTTGKKHVQLSGAKNGKFLTSAAQVYPEGFTRHLIPQILARRPEAGSLTVPPTPAR